MHARAFRECIHHVAGADGGTAEPADPARVPAAREHGIVARLVRMPLIEGAALLEHAEVRDQREERHDDVLLGDREVVDHARVRHVEPHLVRDAAVGVDDVEGEIRRRIAARLIREREQLVALPVELRMRREGDGLEGAVEIPFAARLERVRIDDVRP